MCALFYNNTAGTERTDRTAKFLSVKDKKVIDPFPVFFRENVP